MCWLSCQRSFLFLWPSLIDKAVKSRVLLSHCLPHVCVFLLSLSTETTRNMNSSWCSMIQNDQVLRHSPVRLSIRSCAGTVHSFARSARHPSLARSAALIRSLARSLPSSWESENFDVSKQFGFVPHYTGIVTGFTTYPSRVPRLKSE